MCLLFTVEKDNNLMNLEPPGFAGLGKGYAQKTAGMVDCGADQNGIHKDRTDNKDGRLKTAFLEKDDYCVDARGEKGHDQ